MPAATYQIPGGARVFVFTCDVCGAPASFGVGCNLHAAIRSGDVTKAGQWFCGRVDGIAQCTGKAGAELDLFKGVA